jgi:nucleotide-binding universal stress UspA family protein
LDQRVKRDDRGGTKMRILLAIDGSDASGAAAEEVARRPWPRGSRLRVITVVTLPWTSMSPGLDLENYREDIFRGLEAAARAHAQRLVDEAVALIAEGGGDMTVTAKVLTGSPKLRILDEAERWDADLIVVGAHDYSGDERVMFGSVSQAVVVNARCSVEIVRCRQPTKGVGKK